MTVAEACSAAKRRHETRRVETTAGHLRSPRLKRNRYSINNWSRVGDWRALFPTREFCNDKTPTPYHAPTPQTNFILIAYVSLYCLPVFLIWQWSISRLAHASLCSMVFVNCPEFVSILNPWLDAFPSDLASDEELQKISLIKSPEKSGRSLVSSHRY